MNASDLTRLRPGQWLNDEIINFYGALILDRAERARQDKENNNSLAANGVVNGKGHAKGLKGQKPLKIHYFTSFFWPKLMAGYEKSRLHKWTKMVSACPPAECVLRAPCQFDIFDKDIVILPVNHNNSHWTAACINFRKKRFESYDSMLHPRPMVLEVRAISADMTTVVC